MSTDPASEPKPKSTRGGRQGSGPDAIGEDQLLDELPPSDHHLGRFAGYRAGRGPRRIIAIALVGCGVAAAIAFVINQGKLEDERAAAEYERQHPWTLPEGAELEGRPRDFHMSNGQMRLALSREAPGIQRIILPDKVVTLADGVDAAQIKVKVVDGHTVGIKILSGDVQARDREPGESF